METLADFENKLNLSRRENHGFFVRVFWSFFEKKKQEGKANAKEMLKRKFRSIKAPKKSNNMLVKM